MAGTRGGGGGGRGANRCVVGEDEGESVAMPWWWLFDARDEEVELVCSELLALYRAHDDLDGGGNISCNGSEGNGSRDSGGATTSVGTARAEAIKSPVHRNSGNGVENRGAAESSQASFSEDLSIRRNSSRGT